MKAPHKNNANHSFKKNAKTNQKPKASFPQCLPGTHSHNLTQLGLPWAPQEARIAQIASAHKNRNWKPTTSIKLIESQTETILVFISTTADSLANKAICFQQTSNGNQCTLEFSTQLQ